MRARHIWTAIVVTTVLGAVLFAAGPLSAGKEVPLWVTCLSDLLPAVAGLVTIAAMLAVTARLREWDSAKVAWTCFAAGIGVSTFAEWGWFVAEVILGWNMDELYPSFLDALWIASYGPLVAGLYVTLRGLKRLGIDFGRAVFYLAMGVIFATVVAGVAHFLLLPIWLDPEATGLYKLISLAYPLLDLFLLLPALVLAYACALMGTGAYARPWRFIVVGFVLWTVSDIAYAYLDWIDVYRSGHITDLGWNLGYLFLALGAIAQRDLLESTGGAETRHA